MENVKEFENEAKYKIKDLVSDVEKSIKQGQEQAKNFAVNADKKIKENPWPIVGGVATVALLLGFAMGSSRR